jgi:glycosyltransferase involved in cell wall biosynthesis
VDPEAFHPEGPSVDLRRELGFPEEAFLVGILGRLGPVKGHSYFMDAAERVLKSGVSAGFVVLAKEDSPGVTSLRDRLAADPLLRTGVRLTGYREDLPQVLRAFDLGVVASVGSEANCRVGLEWMASGVPLLATRVGVLPDLVEDGGTGFLVSAADASALAEKIVYLASRQEVARRFGAAARDRVLERFTLAHCAAAHEALIRELSPR